MDFRVSGEQTWGWENAIWEGGGGRVRVETTSSRYQTNTTPIPINTNNPGDTYQLLRCTKTGDVFWQRALIHRFRQGTGASPPYRVMYTLRTGEVQRSLGVIPGSFINVGWTGGLYNVPAARVPNLAGAPDYPGQLPFPQPPGITAGYWTLQDDSLTYAPWSFTDPITNQCVNVPLLLGVFRVRPGTAISANACPGTNF
jgi:hypothetical protein